MDGYRSILLLLSTAGLLALSGANCPNTVRQYATALPRALPPSPSLQQVIEVVNRNSSQIRSFTTTEAKLSGPGFPALRASIAFQRSKRLRLRAETALTGPEIDLGSNDELFWFWVRRNQPPGVYFCRHERFDAGSARQVIPIEPQWLIEAMGIAEFDPALPHQGPFPLPNGRLEVRTIRETAAGTTTKVTIVDGVSGLVLQQRIFDAQGRLLAASTAVGHRQDPLSGLILPAVVDIYCTAARLSMRVELGHAQINRLPGDQSQLWAMPNYPSAPPIDLCDPGFHPPRSDYSSSPKDFSNRGVSSSKSRSPGL